MLVTKYNQIQNAYNFNMKTMFNYISTNSKEIKLQ